MKELQKIVHEAEDARANGKSVALATVVGIEGSAYRLPGARMLIVDGKWVAGSISGGCLEDDVVMRANEAVANGRALVTTYDTTSDDDIVFGVGLGCKGVITILIEPMRAAEDGVDFIAFARSCIEERVSGVAATVIRTEGDTKTAPGNRMVMRSGRLQSDIADHALEAEVRTTLREHQQGTSLVRVSHENRAALLFVERIDPPTPLVIFGAGHDAIPVARLAKDLGWHVTLVDHRPAYATQERFPEADRIVLGSPQEAAAQIRLEPETLALVMTHNYLRDLELLQLLLPSPVRYLGLLGPRRRTDQILGDLQEKGIVPAPAQLERLYAPVGLDIGSEGPAEVAMSILSEMQAVMTRHRGGHLRDRKQPIHQTHLGDPIVREYRRNG